MRCPWPTSNQRLIAYHDEEWGVPVYSDRKLFEFIVLDTFQAGLSWSLILDRREHFRSAFDNFDPGKIALYTPDKIEKLVKNDGIIRNRLKISATVSNARAFLRIKDKYPSFSQFIWDFVDGETKQHRWESLDQLPTSTIESDLMSAELIDQGFKFVGSTICYSFMQAAGLVNDHITSCFRFSELGGVR